MLLNPTDRSVLNVLVDESEGHPSTELDAAINVELWALSMYPFSVLLGERTHNGFPRYVFVTDIPLHVLK
jgi:hypothetical protein